MALQKLKKDPLDSLHQRGTCYVSEACHPPCWELYPGLLLLPPLPLGPPDSGTFGRKDCTLYGPGKALDAEVLSGVLPCRPGESPKS